VIDPQISSVLDDILFQMQDILGEKLIGLYLFGSLATGDFDPASSDIDLLAAISTDLDDAEFNALQKMHESIVLKDQTWDDRIEIAYAPLQGLKIFKTEPYQLGIISPGEPFHIVDADKGWLMNWYMVREKSHFLARLHTPSSRLSQRTSTLRW
jgi:predicted nucleotidyltransferase